MTHILRIQSLLDITMGLLQDERERYPIESWEDFQIEEIGTAIGNAQARAMVLKQYLETENHNLSEPPESSKENLDNLKF